MNAELIRTYLHAAPFIPFTVHLSDGRFFYVDHPDFATLMRDQRNLFINFEGSRHAIVNLDAITHVESKSEASA